jgi:nucleoside-diphosphate-sugar epimerase
LAQQASLDPFSAAVTGADDLVSLSVTGFVGGCVTERLLAQPNTSMTVLVSSEEKAAKLNSLGIATIVGSHADLDKIEKAASESDVVFACVSLVIYTQ